MIEPILSNLGSGILKQSRVVLTDANILVAPTQPSGEVIIAPAPGVNRIVLFQSGIYISTFQTAYDDVSADCYWNLENFGSGAGSGSAYQLGSGYFDSSGTTWGIMSAYADVLKDYIFTGYPKFDYQNYDLAAAINKPMVVTINNANVNFSDGHPNNKLTITMTYLIYNVVTGLFEV